MALESLVQVLEHSSFLSAVLAGFAVTLYVNLLTMACDRRVASVAAGAALLAAALLGIATIAGIGGVVAAILEPELAAGPADQSTVYGAYEWTTTAFMSGMLALVVSLGISGWIRSVRLGTVTTSIATAAVVSLIYFLVSVVRAI